MNNFRKRIFLKIAAAMFLYLSCGNTLAKKNVKFDCGDKPISVAYFEYGLAYSQGIGIDKEIMMELAKRTGCDFIFSVKPRARIWAEIENGALDLATYGLETTDRDKFAWFIPYINSKFYIVLDRKVSEVVKNQEDFIRFSNLKLGIVRSYKHGSEQDLIVERIRKLNRIDESVDVRNLFLKFSFGRFGALLAEPITFKRYLQEFEMDGKYTIQDWAPRQKKVAHGLVLSKKRFDHVAILRWRKVVMRMVADGTLRRIFSKFLTPYEVNEALDFSQNIVNE